MNIWLSGILGVIFITLKLVGVITWSWWWVLLPIYGPLALGVALLLWAMKLTDWEFRR
jgi:hypothetical protein